MEAPLEEAKWWKVDRAIVVVGQAKLYEGKGRTLDESSAIVLILICLSYN